MLQIARQRAGQLDRAVGLREGRRAGTGVPRRHVRHGGLYLRFVNGAQRTVPYGIGIPGGTATPQTTGGPYVGSGTCFYWLHSHDQSGVIHIESPVQKLYTLGDYFAIWGQPLADSQVGPAKGTLTVYVNGTRYTGDPRSITLNAHTLIQLDVGTNVLPQPYTFPAGL